MARVDLLGFTSAKIGRKMKAMLYKVYIRTVLLYGREKMKLGKTDIDKYKWKEGNSINRMYDLEKGCMAKSLMKALAISFKVSIISYEESIVAWNVNLEI